MNSTNAYNLVQILAAISSKTDKQAKLAEIWLKPEREVFRKSCLLALDPFITFGLNKMPKVKFGTEQFNDDTYTMLSRLQSRELSGNAAKDALKIELERLDFESGELLKGIITGKLGGGFTAASINKIQPGAIFLFKICGAKKFNDEVHKIAPKEWEAGVAGEIKEDGVRGCSLPNKDYHLVSRNGLPINSDQELRDQIESFLSEFSIYFGGERRDYDGPVALDGELVSVTESFNKSSGSSRSQDEDRAEELQFRVIDVLTMDEVTGPAKDTYEVSRARLELFFQEFGHEFPRIKLIEKFMFHSEQEVRDKFEEIHTNAASRGERKKEGLMIKRSATKRKPTRIDGWLKVKGCIDVDLTVKAVEAGDPNGKFANTMGALVCDYINDAGNTVEVRIGGGFSIKQRAEIWAAHTGEDQTYTTTDKGVVTEHTVLAEDCESWVGKVIKVKAHEETEDGSLREPRFDVVRDDKTPEDGQGS
ncbi:DNA ligase [Vibrio phage PS14A.1]|nr:DNA ligase [Vibrio phage PS14A.1]